MSSQEDSRPEGRGLKQGQGNQSAGKSDPMFNPWLNSRRAWNSHVGSVVHSRRIWQVVALMSMLIALTAVGGIITLATQSRFIPYVVEVDLLGNSQAVRMADKPGEPDNRVIHASLAQWVRYARTVSFDRAAQNAAVWRVFAMLRTGDAATGKMTTYLQDPVTEPFTRAERFSVGVDIDSVLRQTAESWQVIWTERVWDKSGIQMETQKMRALITIYTVPGTSFTTEEEIRANPLGIYVRDYDWSKIVEAKQ